MSATLSVNLTTPTPNLKPARYHPALVALHWLIALFVFAAALLAMGGGEGGRGGITIAGLPIFGLHMILGITVLVLLVVRLILRWRTQRPDWATTGSAFLDKIGELTHWALYLFTFVITITGLILALQTNRLARVFSPVGAPREQFTPGQLQQSGQFPSGEQFQLGQLADRVKRRFSEGGVSL